ncbi:MAG: translation elongation factor 4 [Fusobacteriota bacterium]
MKKAENIRNFSIIAHIDHGKSTLADRMLEYTGTITKRDMKEQLLDSMDLEREKGITIKSQAVTCFYDAKDNQKYKLNMIDTPGHVDFIYEVSRSLTACEGCLLIVDATQGVEAQTLANVYLALEHDLEIIPVINKIDLPNANIEKVKKEIEEVVGIDASDAVLTSGKTGEGTQDLLEAIVKRIPAPKFEIDKPLRSLIFDSHFDDYRGVITYTRVMEGQVKKGDQIEIMSTKQKFEVLEVGIFSPTRKETGSLKAGDVGYIISGIKNIADTKIGDTITLAYNRATEPLSGYQESQPMVYAGIYPISTDDYEDLRDAIEKLQLNDASLYFEPESSSVLGFGFRAGFLGLLHMEIIVERLRREYGIDLISTSPSVIYRVAKSDGEVLEIDSPIEYPDGQIDYVEEPYIEGTVMIPEEFVGNVMELCQEKRGEFKDMKYLDEDRVMIKYELPLAEIIVDFYDKLKSKTRGYASFEYETLDYRKSDLTKVNILVNKEVVDAFSFIIHRDSAYNRGKAVVEKLKNVIPKKQFKIPLQAAIGSKVIARSTIKALRKDVLSKCYGGDITRKKKLLEKQKEGKKRMKNIGSVDIPQEAFLSILKLDN